MKAEPRDLSAEFAPEITEGRLSRQWASVERRLPSVARVTGGRYFWLRSGLSVGLVVPALALCSWLVLHQREQALSSGAIIESSDAPFAVQLRDGSTMELAAQSQLRVLRDQPSGVKVEIGNGRVSFDVKHVEKRSFEVSAGAVTVRVVGTQFHVVKAARPEGMEIEVAVKRGVVEVQRSDRNGDVRRLAAGETWSVWIAAPATLSTRAITPAAVQAVQVLAPVQATRPQVHELARDLEQPPQPVSSQSGKRPAAEGAAGAVHGEARVEGVRALFLRANVARRGGRMQDAASAYAEVLKRFPHDSRAGVSAFELGRIRMDALGDSAGAAVAFADALRLSRKGEFREDALARLAIAADATGQLEVCHRARARYLAEYDSGVHTAALTSLCGGSKP